MKDEAIKLKAKELRREYMKQWRAENKDKVKKHLADYWERKALKAQSEGGCENEQA